MKLKVQNQREMQLFKQLIIYSTMINFMEQKQQNTNFKELKAKIDDGIKRFHGWYPWEEAILQ